MVPALINPKTNWITPAIKTANKNALNEPKSVMDVNTIAVKPAAGPDTLKWELLKYPTTIPPIIPEIIPENRGAPEAKAIPKHNGKATRKTTKPEAKSDLRFAKRLIFFVIPKINLIQKFDTILTEKMYYIISGGGEKIWCAKLVKLILASIKSFDV